MRNDDVGLGSGRMLGRALIAAVAVAGLSACNTSEPGGTAPPPAATQPTEAPLSGPTPTVAGVSDWSGSQSAAFNDMFVTARDERGWQLMWQLIGEDPPGVLPEGAMALGVFLGARPTSGYAVEIDRVTESGEDVTAYYSERRPPGSGAAAPTLTAPYAVSLVPLSPLPVNYDLD